MLTIAVLSIILSAPVGSILMAIFGPKLLPMSKMYLVETVYKPPENSESSNTLAEDEQHSLRSDTSVSS